jgi:hypothetical protein
MLRFTAVFFGLIWLFGCAAAPVQEMSDARQAIVAARAAGATETNSPDMYAAQAAIVRAEMHLQAQEYTRARLEAMQAKRHAGAALVGIRHADGAPTSGVASPGVATTPASAPMPSSQPL